MAISEAFTGTEAVAATEWSLPRDASYSSASPQTDDGVFQIFLDLSDMVGGDQLEIRVYEKCRTGDTQRIVFEANVVGAQYTPIWVSPTLILMNGWDVTAVAIFGTITVLWSIRKIA